MKRLAVILNNQTDLDIFNKCLERTNVNPVLFFTFNVFRGQYIDIILYDSQLDVNEPWPWDDSLYDTFGDGPKFIRKIYTNIFDGVRPLGYIGTKVELDKFENDLKDNFEIVEYPWEYRLVSINNDTKCSCCSK